MPLAGLNYWLNRTPAAGYLPRIGANLAANYGSNDLPAGANQPIGAAPSLPDAPDTTVNLAKAATGVTKKILPKVMDKSLATKVGGGLTTAVSAYDLVKNGASPGNMAGTLAGTTAMLTGNPAAYSLMAPVAFVGAFRGLTKALKGKGNEPNFKTWEGGTGPFHIDEEGNKYFNARGLQGFDWATNTNEGLIQEPIIRWNAKTQQWEEPLLGEDWDHPIIGNDDATAGYKITGWKPMKIYGGPDHKAYFHPGGMHDDLYSVESFNQYLDAEPALNDNLWADWMHQNDYWTEDPYQYDDILGI